MSTRRPMLLLTAAALLLAGAGCSGDTHIPEPTGPLSAAAPSTRAVAPLHAPDPAAVPATGTSHRVGPLGLVLPASFTATGDTGNDSLRLAQFTSVDPSAIIEVSLTASSSDDLDAAAVAAIADSPLVPTRLEDREVGGRRVYAVSGSDDFTGLYYAVGRSVGGRRVDIAFAFQLDSPANHELIESVLATARWSG